MKTARVLFFLSPLLVAAAACVATKSSDPLSPSVAGPIPGVNITPPVPVDPAGAKVPVSSQPLTLIVANASTTGVRPLSYLFEVATDTGFTNKIFTRDNVTPSDSGRTSLRLPDPLPSGHTYFWRSQAHDGANTSAYSGPANFDVFTPEAIDQPTLVSPIAVATVSNLHPTFVIGNAPRSGPVTAISYTIEVADSDQFVNKAAIWTVREQGGQTSQTSLTAPADLAATKIYFWHARAWDDAISGPWSATQAFKTPTPVVVPPPGGGGGGGGGTAADGGITAAIILAATTGLDPANAGNLQTVVSRLRAQGYKASVLVSNGVPSDHKVWINGSEWSLMSSTGFQAGTFRWDPYLQVEAPAGVAYNSCGIPVNSSFASSCSG